MSWTGNLEKYSKKLRKRVRNRYDAYVRGSTSPRIADLDAIFERYEISIQRWEGMERYERVLCFKYRLGAGRYWVPKWMPNYNIKLDGR